MSKSGDFREYPKILKIENDGRIIALDKHGRVNSQFYTNTITDEDSIKVFGLKFKLLYHDYVNDNLSRVEKNKDSYNENISTRNRPEDYYNERDFRRDLEQQQENTKAKRKNKWLVAVIVVLLIGLVILLFKSCSNGNEQQPTDNNDTSQEQIDNGQSNNDKVRIIE
ncbi:hypothetical protein [Staphylococcus aureus]|uniref:hypothetical protein n=1 Tax=Staphylococcus aureus TaxID=1280 RepID=UPI001BFD3D5A|nr:hypothetical protein [Staphylococcus aureus]